MNREVLPLIDWVRGVASDGALQSVLLSTYGLSQSDPPFFEQDFLPTLLGLGGVKSRGYTAPVTLERQLSEVYCGLICDAHALAAGVRPSLRVDVMPVGRQIQHAKVVLIHRERAVRLIIPSANLTNEGYRVNREAAAVLDFSEQSALDPNILAEFATEWLNILGPIVTKDFRAALSAAVEGAKLWRGRATGSKVRVVWGGGAIPMWRHVVEAWPKGERLMEWQVCSPFWPKPGEANTPFDVFRGELESRDAAPLDAQLRLFSAAETAGAKARPCFPFKLVEQLHSRGFRPQDAIIWPVRLDVLNSETEDGPAVENRLLHAKWIYLRGERTAVLLLGSANFTRRGLGTVKAASDANIEVGVLISGPVGVIDSDGLMPPLADDGQVRWNDCRDHHVATDGDDIEFVKWPAFIAAADLEVEWAAVPVTGRLRVTTSGPEPFSVHWQSGTEVHAVEMKTATEGAEYWADLDAEIVSALLAHRSIIIRWGAPAIDTAFPINIASECKVGMPSVIGQNPTEQDLLAYFRGRIDEEDLVEILQERERRRVNGDQPNDIAPPDRELQNYIVREFLEGLYGMEDTLQQAAASERLLENALVGEFSPVRMAIEVHRAAAAGRRTPTAACFQLLELVQIVGKLKPPSSSSAPWFASVQDRAITKLLEVVRSAAENQNIRGAATAPSFKRLVDSVLGAELGFRWTSAMEKQ